jgi:hypothetical protein
MSLGTLGTSKKGFIKNLETGEVKEFQFNPEFFNYGRSVSYNETSSPSSPYPLISYGNGNSSSFSVPLFLYDPKASGLIEAFIAFVDSLLPQVDTGGFVERNPKPKVVLFCYGRFIKKCVIQSMDYTHEMYTKNIIPIRTTINLTFLEVSGIKLDPFTRPGQLTIGDPINSDTPTLVKLPTLNPYTVNVLYAPHCENIGWKDYVSNGEESGTTGQGLRLEALKIKLEHSTQLDLSVKYQCHIQNLGWDSIKTEDTVCGTVGEWLRLEAIKIWLEGADAGKFDIFYRMHVQNLGWMDWVQNGSPAGSAGFSLRGEAIKIMIVTKV